MKKFHLRVPGLRLCWQHELAAISTVGSDFNGSLHFYLAWIREQEARLRLWQQLFAFQSGGRKKIRSRALKFQN